VVAQVFRGSRQRLQNYVRRFKQEGRVQKRLARELKQERERRQQAESRLKQFQEGTAPVVTGQTHALTEPDESISRLQIFLSLVSPLKPGKMLDLGTGPGTFSLAAARLGWEVTAVDARTVRTPDPEAAKDPDHAKLIRSVRWVEADVREFPIRDGDYDLICIFGLMHHLELEDQIKLLKRCSGTRTLLTVRVAPEIVATEGAYEGMYRYERGETREERDQIPQAAWGNEVDFWHTEESLLRLMRDCGYSKTMVMRPPHRPNYTFYLCLPPPDPKRRR
jgi:2-polyprenyl-3-methyl-5-hydroxy-6-metoxy-1,4-benzoquinol methylase